MTVQLFKNNAHSTLNGTLSIGGATLSVAVGHGSRFPTPSAGEYFLITLYEKDGSGNEINYEVVKVTAITGDSLTIVRDFEGLVVANGGTSGGWAFPSAPGINPSGVVYIEMRYTAYAAANTLNKDSIKTINGNSLLGAGDLEIAGGGGGTLSLLAKTSNYTVVAGDLGKIVNVSGGSINITLSSAISLGGGFNCSVFNSSTDASHVVTVLPSDGQTIDGQNSIKLYVGEGYQFLSDGVGWVIASQRGLRSYAENRLGSTTRPQATGGNSVAFGYGQASGSSSVAFGGQANSGNTFSVNGVANGESSIVLGTGGGNWTATFASGPKSVCIGNDSTAQGEQSYAIGSRAQSSVYGQHAYASGGFSDVTGSAQTNRFVCRGITSGASPTTLTTNGIDVLPHSFSFQRSQAFTALVIGRSVENFGTTSSVAAYRLEGVVTDSGDMMTFSLLGLTKTVIYETNAAWDVTVTAGATGGIAITATGVSGKTIRWVATVITTEVQT